LLNTVTVSTVNGKQITEISPNTWHAQAMLRIKPWMETFNFTNKCVNDEKFPRKLAGSTWDCLCTSTWRDGSMALCLTKMTSENIPVGAPFDWLTESGKE
jgi:hypothetical protein